MLRFGINGFATAERIGCGTSIDDDFAVKAFILASNLPSCGWNAGQVESRFRFGFWLGRVGHGRIGLDWVYCFLSFLVRLPA